MASFAYLDPLASLIELSLGSTLGSPIQQNETDITVEAIPWEADDEWKEFEQTLGEFKLKYTQILNEYIKAKNRLNNCVKNTSISRVIDVMVQDQDLKDRLMSVVDNYETEAGTVALSQQCGVLKGKIEGMEAILKDTNAHRYERFTCPICADKHIDLFIEPCGHTICDACWMSTRDKRRCPVCSTTTTSPPVKKIFTI